MVSIMSRFYYHSDYVLLRAYRVALLHRNARLDRGRTQHDDFVLAFFLVGLFPLCTPPILTMTLTSKIIRRKSLLLEKVSILMVKRSQTFMEGVYFVYCSWLLVIILLFFVNNSQKNIVLMHVLVALFLSQFPLVYEDIMINSAAVYLILITCGLIAGCSLVERLQLYVISFILALVQGSYLLYVILEPLWFKWIPSWFIAFLTVYACSLLVSGHINRILSLVMGTVISDVLLFLVHQQNQLMYEFLQLAWLDRLSVVAIMYCLLGLIEIAGKYFFTNSRYIQKKEV